MFVLCFYLFPIASHCFAFAEYTCISERMGACMNFANICTYEAIVISDHCLLLLKLKFQGVLISHSCWRLDTTMFSDIATNIKVYITTNCIPDMSHCTVWEAFKAHQRGLLISASSFAKKQHAQTLNDLTDKISQFNSPCYLKPDTLIMSLVRRHTDSLLISSGGLPLVTEFLKLKCNTGSPETIQK